MKKKVVKADEIKAVAIDDEKFRENIHESVSKISGYIDESVKEKKATIKYLYMMIGVFVLILGGSLLTIIIKSGGVGTALDNLFPADDVNIRIVCSEGTHNITYREPISAYRFKQVFNNSECWIKDRGKK